MDSVRPRLPATRRRLLQAAGSFFLAGGGLVPCSAGAAATDAGNLAAELGSAVPKGTKLVVAEQANEASVPWALSGASKDAPYTPTFATFNGGPAVLEALIAGAADIGYVGEAPLPIAVAQGVTDLVAIGLNANPGSPDNYYLVVQPNSGIKTPAELRGRSVAYPPGTGRHMVLAAILQEAGLDLQSSVRGVQVSGSEVAPTFASRSTDAALILGHQYFRLGEPPIIADGRGHNWGLNALLVRRTALDNPAKSAAFGDFLRRAVLFFNWQSSHADEWIQASYVQQMGLTFAQGKRLDDEAGHGAFYPIDDRAAAVYQQVADGLVTTGAIKRKIDIAPYLDGRFNRIVAWQNQTGGVVPRSLEQPKKTAKAGD